MPFDLVDFVEILDDQPFWKTEEVPALVAEQRQILAQATAGTSSERPGRRGGLALLMMLAAGMVVVRYRSS